MKLNASYPAQRIVQTIIKNTCFRLHRKRVRAQLTIHAIISAKIMFHDMFELYSKRGGYYTYVLDTCKFVNIHDMMSLTL